MDINPRASGHKQRKRFRNTPTACEQISLLKCAILSPEKSDSGHALDTICLVHHSPMAYLCGCLKLLVTLIVQAVSQVLPAKIFGLILLVVNLLEDIFSKLTPCIISFYLLHAA